MDTFGVKTLLFSKRIPLKSHFLYYNDSISDVKTLELALL